MTESRAGARRVEQALLALFALCIVWAPLPLGGNRWWAVGLLSSALWTLVLAAGVVVLASGQSLAARLAPCRVLLFPMAAFTAWVALQVTGVLTTADVFETRHYLLMSSSYLAAAVLVALLATSPVRVQMLLLAIVASGVLQAVIAVVLFSGGGAYEYLFVVFEPSGRATGTFPNPDHLAGFMELCLSAGLGLVVGLMGGRAQRTSATWMSRLIDLLGFVLSPTMVLRLVLVVMVIALIMTHSRMGNAAFFLGMLVVGVWVVVVSQRFRRTALILMTSVVVIDLLLIGQWVGLERVVERLHETELRQSYAQGTGAIPEPRPESVEERLRAPRRALAIVERWPWAGTGGGTFYAVFPPYKTPDMPYFYNHAHNDFVEVAADTGLVGLALWVSIGLVTLPRLARRIRDNQPRLNAAVAIAAALALSCMTLHGMVDFNLQIPANALVFVILLALPWAPGLTAQAFEARSPLRARMRGVAQPMAPPRVD